MLIPSSSTIKRNAELIKIMAKNVKKTLKECLMSSILCLANTLSILYAKRNLNILLNEIMSVFFTIPVKYKN